MKTPAFWYASPGLYSTLLQPFSWVYDRGGRVLRLLQKSHPGSLPIISVGSVICGGSGKTPTAIALANLLQTRGIKVHFVSRGYKGKLQGPLQVSPSFHNAGDVGDEPLLLAQHAPTWVAKNRPLGVQKAKEAGAHLIILDDGHQTSSLSKDISFVVVDLLQGFGNGSVIPAGPLRENPTQGLKRATALIQIGDGQRSFPLPSFKAKIVPQPLTPSSKKAVAFCGLGFPEKFYKILEDLSINLTVKKSFPDHYMYTEKDLSSLYKLAESHQAILVTTRKDSVKIPPSWQKHLHILDINIEFEDPEDMYDFILQKIPTLRK